jgi:hypothetical protein
MYVGKKQQEKEFIEEFLLPVMDWFKHNPFPLSPAKIEELYLSWRDGYEELSEVMEFEKEILPQISPELHKLSQIKFNQDKILYRRREFPFCRLNTGKIHLRKTDKREAVAELAHESAHLITRLDGPDEEVLPELAELATMALMKSKGILPNKVVANHKLCLSNIAVAAKTGDIDRIDMKKRHAFGAIVSLRLKEMLDEKECTFEDLLVQSYEHPASLDYRARVANYGGGVTPESVLGAVKRYTKDKVMPIAELNF